MLRMLRGCPTGGRIVNDAQILKASCMQTD